MKEELVQLVKIWLKVGVNLQQNQLLYVTLPIECEYLKNIIDQVSLGLGAGDVVYQFTKPYDILLQEYQDNFSSYEAVLDSIFKTKIMLLSKQCAYLEIRQGIDFFDFKNEEQLKVLKKIESKYITQFRSEKRNIGNVVSCKTVIPTRYWADRVFPNQQDALSKLWNIYFEVTLANRDDGVKAWENRIDEIQQKVKYLNDQQFQSLCFTTDKSNLSIELIDHNVWVGGCETTVDGIRYMPNFPTQEIFTAPKKYGVHGILHNTKPLCYGGKILNEFVLYFSCGKVVKWEAMQNETVLEEILCYDETSCYSGEIAILPGVTEISKVNTVFKTTLLDENAACHLALGCAYPCSINKKMEYKRDSFEKMDMNFSKTHVDIMFGDTATSIVATDCQGKKFNLMQQGKWCI